jgi:hypothetical protein
MKESERHIYTNTQCTYRCIFLYIYKKSLDLKQPIHLFQKKEKRESGYSRGFFALSFCLRWNFMLRFYLENFIIGWNEILFRTANLLWWASERQAANKMSRATLNFLFSLCLQQHLTVRSQNDKMPQLVFRLPDFQCEYNIRLCFGNYFLADETAKFLVPSVKEKDQKLTKCYRGDKGNFQRKQSNASDAKQFFFNFYSVVFRISKLLCVTWHLTNPK